MHFHTTLDEFQYIYTTITSLVDKYNTLQKLKIKKLVFLHIKRTLTTKFQ